MGFQRLFLTLILFSSIFLIWENWQREQHPEQYTAVNKAEVPINSLPLNQLHIQGLANDNREEKLPTSSKNQIIKVNTGTFSVEINSLGGDIQRVDLVRHKDAQDQSKPFTLLRHDENIYIAQTGLIGEGLANHKTLFKSNSSDYSLANDQDILEVRLTSEDTKSNRVTKTFLFHRDSYVIDINQEIENMGVKPIIASAYFQLVRDGSSTVGESKMVPTYTGPAVYTEQEKFQKVDFSSIDKNKTSYPKNTDNGWIGMLQHYFVVAWLPKDKEPREFFTKKLENGLYAIGVITAVPTIEPGQKVVISAPLYIGPAQSKLNDIAPGLGLTVDYGWLTVIATPLFWLLTQIQGVVQNWGVAIVLLTVLIKLAFFPLSAASYRSMAKMRVVAPKLEKLKKQYEGDRDQLNRAMMDLYKTEKINPLGGCLPVIIQIPVFIALYWSILSSVEMRHAPFFGWITDLSVADPYYILPAIMGISMLIQSKLNPTPPDPLQAKLMQLMPIIFSVVFFFFPAGLVLYSVVNNVLSIAQQWYITQSLSIETKGATKT
jgi:YidC/Oxa1 family membrane protein insertase